MRTLKQVTEMFEKYRVYSDKGVIKMLALSVIANQLIDKSKKPLWIVFVAPPSGGKTDIVATISTVMKNDKALCERISDASYAAFASGMQNKSEEISILERLDPNGGILLFKDFTTVLSKRKEDFIQIMGLLREVYDGEFDKPFGNGVRIEYRGKCGMIACCTPIIYHRLPELAAMGERLLMYQIEQPEEEKVFEKIWQNEDAGIDGTDEMTLVMKEYIEEIFAFILKERATVKDIRISKEERKEFGNVASFICAARTSVEWNFKHDTIMFGGKDMKESPYRMLKQFIAMATGLIVMNIFEGGEPVLTKDDTAIIYKTAFDSIPLMRREVIRIITKYMYGVTTQGVADAMGRQHQAVQIWLDELTAVGVIFKRKDAAYGAGDKEKYFISEKFKEIIKTYENITEIKKELVSTTEVESENIDMTDL